MTKVNIWDNIIYMVTSKGRYDTEAMRITAKVKDAFIEPISFMKNRNIGPK